jgi:thymidylate kinase
MIKKHIIFEGENGTGKTTLINRVRAKYPELLSHHFQFPKGETNAEKIAYQHGQFDLMFDNLSQLSDTNVRYIFDRSHIGENYWSLKFRNWRPDYLWKLERIHSNLPIHIINIVAEDEDIHKRMIDRGEAPTDIEEIGKNQVGISRFCRDSIFPSVTINTSKYNIDECVNQILEVIERD